MRSDNKNAPRIREALCFLKVPIVSVTSVQAQISHGETGGSSHGHHKWPKQKFHIGRNYMRVEGMRQGENFENSKQAGDGQW